MPTARELGLPDDDGLFSDEEPAPTRRQYDPRYAQQAQRKPTGSPVAKGTAGRPASALDEVDDRLTLASYYRAVLSEPVFNDPSDPFARRVQQELNEFIAGRMKDLVGVGKPKPQDALTEPEVRILRFIAQSLSGDEVQALKLLAQRVMSAPQRAAAPPPPPPAAPEPEKQEEAIEPTPRKAPEPRIRSRSAPRKPAVRKAEVPAGPQRSQRRASTPAAAPTAPAPVGFVMSGDDDDSEETTPEAPAAPDNSPKPLAMPTGAAMTAVSQQQAYQALGEPVVKLVGAP